MILDVPTQKKCLKRKEDMNDQEKTPPENVIKGPWPVKSGREVKLPDEDIIAVQQDIQFAGELSQSLIVQMIHTMSENGINISENTFIRDVAMIIELVQGTIYRDMNLAHPTHKFMEEFVDLIVKPDNTVETEVDFNTITNLVDLLEDDKDDDEPEIS
jgi:hypothetical protein